MENTSGSPPPAASGAHTSDERTMAALAHASALLNFVVSGFGGLIGAGLIWLTQKEKSAWVAFHGLQSLVFQAVQFALFLVIVILPWILGFLCSFLTFGFGAILAVPLMFLTLGLGLVAMLGGLAYSLYGAYEVYQGREFRYQWVADWLETRPQAAAPAPAGAPGPSYSATPSAPSGAGPAIAIGIGVAVILGTLVLCAAVVVIAIVILALLGPSTSSVLDSIVIGLPTPTPYAP